jgi:hypothetical protein
MTKCVWYRRSDRPCVRSTQQRAVPLLTGHDTQRQVTCCTECPVNRASASHVRVKYRMGPVAILDVSGLVWKTATESNTECVWSLCQTRPVSLRPVLSTHFSTPLFLCANTKVSYHLCTCVSIFTSIFKG